MKTLFSLVSCILLSLLSFSQVEQSERIEFELKDGYSNEKITPLGKNGALLKAKKTINGVKTWKYTLYNNQLKELASQSIAIDKNKYFDENFSDESTDITFFKSRKGTYTIAIFNAETNKIRTLDGVLPKKCWVKDMAVSNNKAYFSAQIKKQPFLFVIDLKTGIQKPIPVYIKDVKPKRTKLQEFQILEEAQEVVLFVEGYTKTKAYQFHAIILDNKGEKKQLINLSKGHDKSIVAASLSKKDDHTYLASGTYSEQMQRVSNGIFFASFSDKKSSFLKFHPYTELSDFLSYLPKKKQAKLDRKKARKKKKGKELLLNYFLAQHEIIEVQGGYVLIGEAYYPTYRTESRTTYVNGQPTTTYVTVFDGYQYTHALVAKFSFDGKLLWDKTFEMWPRTKPYYVKRFISVKESDSQKIAMVFTSRSKIYSKEFNTDGTVTYEKSSEKIESNNDSDKTKWSLANLKFWYDDAFILYGSQKIKDKESSKIKKKRKVYFISKFTFE